MVFTHVVTYTSIMSFYKNTYKIGSLIMGFFNIKIIYYFSFYFLFLIWHLVVKDQRNTQ